MKAPKIGKGPMKIPPAAFTFESLEVNEDVKTKIKPTNINNKPILSMFSIFRS